MGVTDFGGFLCERKRSLNKGVFGRKENVSGLLFFFSRFRYVSKLFSLKSINR